MMIWLGLGLQHGSFQVLRQPLGPHSVDRFANSCNKQVDRYNSLKGLKMDTLRIP